jgi:hypothetical protein
MERPVHANVESYEEMMRRYETFHLYVPEVGLTVFKGAENERANYARLMHMSGAEITNYVTRIDLVRAIADLTAGHYSRRPNATASGSVLAWVPIASYSGELDGERVQFHVVDNRPVSFGAECAFFRFADEHRGRRGCQPAVQTMRRLPQPRYKQLCAVGANQPGRLAAVPERI